MLHLFEAMLVEFEKQQCTNTKHSFSHITLVLVWRDN